MADRRRQLVLLRHGQTEWNAADRMQGQSDTDLTDLGRTQAKEAARLLASLEPLAIVSSDLRRAVDTAAELAVSTGVSVELDPRLRETDLGDWQGLDHRQVDRDYPGARTAWRADPRIAPPGGECRVEVADRMLPVVADLLVQRPDWPGRVIVLVSHGGAISALTTALLGLPLDNWPALGGLANASWVQLSQIVDEARPRWRLDVWNASARVATDVG
ncbi:histidine phosphatase family protein [Skermania piniformis]|uniref:Histidine phosphatase family protein n=1 Tax=Skermania pinensis TaxID=39122 RepID=A0ABX8SGX3_9ACTN|nr:histidine phosphatase family protein [Skermania piniformis]QXQ14926.1 histidine phosphatase family protein [Skermania piniformis]